MIFSGVNSKKRFSLVQHDNGKNSCNNIDFLVFSENPFSVIATCLPEADSTGHTGTCRFKKNTRK